MGAEVCALSTKYHNLWWFICRCGPKTTGPLPSPLLEGEDLIRNQLGRAKAQPSSELNAKGWHPRSHGNVLSKVADQVWSSLKVEVIKSVKGFALRKQQKTALQLSTTAGRAKFCLFVWRASERTRWELCPRLCCVLRNTEKGIAQAFASRPSVGHKLVHCSMSEFSDVPLLPYTARVLLTFSLVDLPFPVLGCSRVKSHTAFILPVKDVMLSDLSYPLVQFSLSIL